MVHVPFNNCLHSAVHIIFIVQTMGYKIFDVEKGYYADGEDAYNMRMTFTPIPDPVMKKLNEQVGKLKVSNETSVSSSSSSAKGVSPATEVPTHQDTADNGKSTANAGGGNKNKKNKKKK